MHVRGAPNEETISCNDYPEFLTRQGGELRANLFTGEIGFCEPSDIELLPQLIAIFASLRRPLPQKTIRCARTASESQSGTC